MSGRTVRGASIILLFMFLGSVFVPSLDGVAAQDPIEFAPPHSGHPVDVDSDSLYEIFAVNVSLNVTEPGWYAVTGFLFTPDTYLTSGVWLTRFALFEVGTSVAVLNFSSFYIRAYGLDGTFIVNLQLSAQNGTKYANMNWTLGNYNGASFDYSLPATINGALGDSGLNTDSDSKFEYLVISVQVQINVEGFYGLTAWIPALTVDSTGYSRVTANLTAGLHTMDVRFRGDMFVNAAIDGPYLVEIGLSDGSFNPYLGFFDARSHTTQSYAYTDFEASAGASFVSHSDESLDINDDGAQEYISVHVNLYVDVPGIYNISGRLSVIVGFIETVWERTNLGAGNQTVTLLFPGDVIKASKWNDSYLIFLNISDADGELLSSPVFFTEYYTWVVFAKPPVAAVVASQSGGNDDEGFLLNASVSVVEAMYYEVRWDFDSDGVWDTGWSAIAEILYAFPGAGDYLVTVEVKDIRGLTNKTSLMVHVPSGGLVATEIPWGLVAVGVVAVAAVAVFLAWPLESLVVIFLALLLPLYSRLSKEAILDNYKRGVIHGLILAHPGISFTEMKEALSISSGSLVYHLSILQEKGEVLCRKSGTTMRYYLDGSPAAQMVRLGMTDFQLEIVKHILAAGEITKKDLRAAVKSSRQMLHYNLKKLMTDGMVVSSLSGGHRMYRIAAGVKSELSHAMESREPQGDTLLQDSTTPLFEG